MNILAIDPGTHESGVIVLSASDAVLEAATMPNHAVLQRIKDAAEEVLAIEMIQGMGMPVGQETFDTARWIGRFQEAWRSPDSVVLVFRREVKLRMCGSPRAKDSNIRQALIDELGAPGTKKAPGPTYGVTSHAWQALGVAVTARAKLLGTPF